MCEAKMAEQQLNFRLLIARVLASGKLAPEGLIELLSKAFAKGSIDPGLVFSKFMAAYADSLLKPDDARSDGHKPSPNTERAFDLLWLAYEQWLNRGVTHLSEAAGLWTTFYGNIRWTLVHNRNDANFQRNLDKFVAHSAQEWLSEVRKLTRKNFDLLVSEMDGVIDELKKIEASDPNTNEATNITGKNDGQNSGAL
jgi:hypothetical protein